MSMARANCTCATCGHTFEVRAKRANSRDAASFEKWAEENITECDDCKAARIQAAHDAENAEAAKSLPGALYDSPGVTVPERSWDALTDFAARYGYRFTAAAQDKLDRLSGAARAVEPAPVRKPEYEERDVLNSSREVLEDLKDA